MSAPGVRELFGIAIYVGILAALMGAGILEVRVATGEGAERKTVFSNIGECPAVAAHSCPTPTCSFGVSAFVDCSTSKCFRIRGSDKLQSY